MGFCPIHRPAQKLPILYTLSTKQGYQPLVSALPFDRLVVVCGEVDFVPWKVAAAPSAGDLREQTALPFVYQQVVHYCYDRLGEAPAWLCARGPMVHHSEYRREECFATPLLQRRALEHHPSKHVVGLVEFLVVEYLLLNSMTAESLVVGRPENCSSRPVGGVPQTELVRGLLATAGDY